MMQRQQRCGKQSIYNFHVSWGCSVFQCFSCLHHLLMLLLPPPLLLLLPLFVFIRFSFDLYLCFSFSFSFSTENAHFSKWITEKERKRKWTEPNRMLFKSVYCLKTRFPWNCGWFWKIVNRVCRSHVYIFKHITYMRVHHSYPSQSMILSWISMVHRWFQIMYSVYSGIMRTAYIHTHK